MRNLLFLGLVLPMLAGCVSTDGNGLGRTSDAADPSANTAVIVGIIDTGIQPYHEAFKARPGWAPPQIPGAITLGADFRDRALGSLEVWNELQPDQIYHFEGTRIFAVSKFRESGAVNARENPYLIYDDEVGDLGHGTGTASLVAQASPNATILMIESSGSITNVWAWILEQPWIDIVDVNQGSVANLPSLESGPDQDALITEQIVAKGKLIVASAGNEPVPNLMDDTAAPWIAAVGGAQESTHGESVLASKLVDFVANFTSDRVAKKTDLNTYYRNGGTSFTAPVVAGTLAEALYRLRVIYDDAGLHPSDGALVRGSDKVLTNADIRAALNATAMYWDTTEYNPAGYPYTSWRDAVATSAPVLPAIADTPIGPWIQMGWGFVDERLVPEIVAILSGEKPMPEKPAGAYEWMQRVQAVKEEYWRIRQG